MRWQYPRAPIPIIDNHRKRKFQINKISILKQIKRSSKEQVLFSLALVLIPREFWSETIQRWNADLKEFKQKFHGHVTACVRDNTTWVVIPVATVAAWIRKMPIFRYRIFWNVISRSLGQALFPPRSFCHPGIPIALTTEFTTRPLSGSVPLINRLCVQVVPATVV